MIVDFELLGFASGASGIIGSGTFTQTGTVFLDAPVEISDVVFTDNDPFTIRARLGISHGNSYLEK